MLLRTFAIVCLLISCSSVDARRRSRIDLPIQNAADAPLEDNVATASGLEKVETEKMEVEKKEVEKVDEPEPMPTTVQNEVADVSESNSSEESPAYDDCDLDNISFEMITG